MQFSHVKTAYSHYAGDSIKHHKLVWKEDFFRLINHPLVQIDLNYNLVASILSIAFLLLRAFITVFFLILTEPGHPFIITTLIFILKLVACHRH